MNRGTENFTNWLIGILVIIMITCCIFGIPVLIKWIKGMIFISIGEEVQL